MSSQLKIKGQLVHKKTARSRYGREDIAFIRQRVDPNAEWVDVPGKHKYLYPLTPEMRVKIEPLAKPYPKRASNKGNHPDQGQGGGAVPT